MTMLFGRRSEIADGQHFSRCVVGGAPSLLKNLLLRDHRKQLKLWGQMTLISRALKQAFSGGTTRVQPVQRLFLFQNKPVLVDASVAQMRYPH
jgi:hypothetical protein